MKEMRKKNKEWRSLRRGGVLAVLIATLVIGLVSLGRGDSSRVKVFYPYDKEVVMGGGYVHLVLEVHEYLPQEVETGVSARLKASLNDDPLLPIRVADVERGQGVKLVHYGTQLKFGLNTFSITYEEKDGSRMAPIQRQVFFYSILADDKQIPKGFEPLPFHREGADQKCRDCHRMESKASDILPPLPEDSTCYPCHHQITDYKQVHGPASLWACLNCHDANSSPARYQIPVPIVRDLCYRCHQDAREYFFSNKYQHGPTSTGMCVICHNPHGTNNPYWLKKSPWYLCTTCHFEKASGRHVIAWGPSGSTHPTRGKPDPTKPQLEFACNTCHNPHAAPGAKLWNFEAENRAALCPNCHPKEFGTLP